MTQDHTEKIAETYFWIEDLEYDLHLDIILEEIYGKGTRHDFDPIEEEVYIFVPYK
jgi:hypothetical protein